VVLNKRERNLVFGVGATIGVLLLYYVVSSLYWDPRSQALTDIATASDTLQQDSDLVNAMPILNKQWNSMVNEGLASDESQAEGELRQAILKWTEDNNIVLETTETPHAQSVAQFPQFQSIDFVVGFEVSGDRSMYSIAHMLWAIESAKVPFQVTEMQLKSVRDGEGQLSVTLKVSALCMPPTNNPSNTPAAGAPAPAGDM
jgi:hypothetical protein